MITTKLYGTCIVILGENTPSSLSGRASPRRRKWTFFPAEKNNQLCILVCSVWMGLETRLDLSRTGAHMRPSVKLSGPDGGMERTRVKK